MSGDDALQEVAKVSPNESPPTPTENYEHLHPLLFMGNRGESTMTVWLNE
jgi:hypothetical protein